MNIVEDFSNGYLELIAHIFTRKCEQSANPVSRNFYSKVFFCRKTVEHYIRM